MKRGHFIAATAAVVVASPLLPLETTGEVIPIDPSLLVDESMDSMMVRYQAVGGALSMKSLEDAWEYMQYVLDENGDRVIVGPRLY
jgi:hypothetical protein